MKLSRIFQCQNLKNLIKTESPLSAIKHTIQLINFMADKNKLRVFQSMEKFFLWQFISFWEIKLNTLNKFSTQLDYLPKYYKILKFSFTKRATGSLSDRLTDSKHFWMNTWSTWNKIKFDSIESELLTLLYSQKIID